MDVWTVQRKSILRRVKRGETYMPCWNLGSAPYLFRCYRAALMAVNRLNSSRFDGVIFGISEIDGAPFRSPDGIRELLKRNRNLEGFFSMGDVNLLRDEGFSLVRLRYPDDMDPAGVDIFAFMAMEPFIRETDDGSGVFFDMEAPADMREGLRHLDAMRVRPMYDSWQAGMYPCAVPDGYVSFRQLHYGFIAPGNLTGEEYPSGILIP